ncbi:MAG: riboflavin synthase [Nitrosopumilus sp.]|jgi:riboflavin synthase|nr:riboflavin synthase [Nitrosopumilus sp.]MBT3685608.1 riboflavin synthase [Nitrosopumilus sp.]MBT3924900.1 riboflavin synthase [Nitrosopumilus sp.]MBT4216333.1 riboflavin synthase [Nitrosopumilus sp.]MBT7474312.1 riboflavin synthase [Nitrosopumilus sp.]
MFTGIVEGIGTVNKISKITKNRSAIEMTIDLGKQVKGLKIGQSVALNGVCLTATKISKSKCIFEMIEETTKKTDLGNLKVGGVVNIERSLKAGDRLEGHFVLGHVDGVAIIKKILKKPKEVQVYFEVPKTLAKYVVKKGSIAIDGISLTVVDIKKTLAYVSLIPHTIEITNFHTKKVGDKVNIETDILGKYILKQA